MLQFVVTAALALVVAIDHRPGYPGPGKSARERRFYRLLIAAGWAMLMLGSLSLRLPGILTPLQQLSQRLLGDM